MKIRLEDASGLLHNEFFNLYRSLFKKYELYEKLVEVLATKNEGLQRNDIIRLSASHPAQSIFAARTYIFYTVLAATPTICSQNLHFLHNSGCKTDCLQPEMPSLISKLYSCP